MPSSIDIELRFDALPKRDMKSMLTQQSYFRIFREILSRAPADTAVEIDDLLADKRIAHTTEKTRRGHVKAFVCAFPEYFDRIAGLYPPPDVVIDRVEAQIGPVTERNICEANERCAGAIREIGQPILRKFIRSSLSEFIVADHVSLGLDRMVQFLVEDYSEFSKSTGNGLVSIAGSINESLIRRALINGGLVERQHFTRTGTNAEGDLVAHSAHGIRENLFIEVKSYHARERLLRGLKDIQGPKVGVGFFRDASEFNGERTVTLLGADPAAIYMPSATLEAVSSDARVRKVNSRLADGSCLYRPIEQFVTDLQHYCDRGFLPPYLR